MENKQIIINKDLHKKVKSYCALTEQQIKEYTEAALQFAINNQLTVEDLKEKQYLDSYASTSIGGPMIRYGNKGKEEQEEQEEQGENILQQLKKTEKEDDVW